MKPSRHPEYTSPEPEHRGWPLFGDEEKKDDKKEEFKEKNSDSKQKAEDKKTEKRTESKKETSNKEDGESKKKERTLEEKQERRIETVERSHALKKQFEEAPIPNNPSTVARLIIAEQILEIDEQLHQPDASKRTGTTKELEATLDYMCDLAEKFEDPTIDSPPHIQEAYETLLELTQEALQTTDEPTIFVEEMAEAFHLEPQEIINAVLTDPTTHATSVLPPTIAASPAAINLFIYLQVSSSPIYNSLGNVPLQPSASASSSSYTGGGAKVPSAPQIPTNSTGPKQSATVGFNERYSQPDAPRSVTPDANEYHIAMQPNIAKPLAAVALASVVAASVHKGPTFSHRHENVPPAPIAQTEKYAQSPTPSIHTDIHPISYSPNPIKYETDTATAPTSPVEHGLPSHPHEAPPPNRKLEHMPLISLLTLAKEIQVGHGRYLKDEFEHGRIDKDGLIKVLKAKKKGLDISREFSIQAANFRQRQASIEFLTKKSPQSTVSHENNDESPLAEAPPPQESKEPSLQNETFAHPILERYTHPEKSVFQHTPTKNTAPTTILVTVVAIIIFGIFLLLLLPVLL